MILSQENWLNCGTKRLLHRLRSPPPEDEKDKQKKGRPEDNTKQNKQVEDAARDEKLNPKERRELGRAVENESRGHGRNLDYHDIREIAKDIKNGKQ